MNGLREQHQPRRCNTNPGAVFCALHGDCNCHPVTHRRSASCPLHGATSDHPSEPRMVTR